jgi:hypothetical protein
MKTIYLIENGKGGVSLRCFEPASVGCGWGKRIDPRWLELKPGSDDVPFVVAARTIAGAEVKQRVHAAELLAKRSRNLTTEVEYPFVVLARTFHRRTDVAGGVHMNIEEAQALLKDALGPVKKMLGMPEVNPVEEAFEITDVVMDAAVSERAKAMLSREMPHGVIFPQRLKLIEDRFSNELGAESAPVIQALKDTVNRRHLALITLGGDRRGEARVTIIDETKNRLEVPAWKLLDMLDHPGLSRKLYTFPAGYASERYPEVVFNGVTSHDLVGKYRPDESRLEVVNIVPPKQVGARADKQGGIVTFYLDQDYLACLWIVLARVAADQRRYDDLFKEAEARVDYDPLG